jgi:hypothetical protein
MDVENSWRASFCEEGYHQIFCESPYICVECPEAKSCEDIYVQVDNDFAILDTNGDGFISNSDDVNPEEF